MVFDLQGSVLTFSFYLKPLVTLVLGSPFTMQSSPPGMTVHLLVAIVSRKNHFLLESRVFGECSSPSGSVGTDAEQKKRSSENIIKMPGEEWDEPVLDYCHPASEDPK